MKDLERSVNARKRIKKNKETEADCLQVEVSNHRILSLLQFPSYSFNMYQISRYTISLLRRYLSHVTLGYLTVLDSLVAFKPSTVFYIDIRMSAEL